MASEDTLRDRILDATEKVLSRHGADKTNVVDVAQILEMSPTNIYRFFRSKKALLEAVAVRWIEALTAPIDAIAADRSRPASERLELWFDGLRKAKRKKLIDEPELFRVYLAITGDDRKSEADHVKKLLAQLELIIIDGKKAGEFPASIKPKAAARAFLHATSAFHHPALVMQGVGANDAEARALIKIVVAGLRGTGGEVRVTKPRMKNEGRNSKFETKNLRNADVHSD